MIQILALPLRARHSLPPSVACLAVLAAGLTVLLAPFFLAFATPGFYQGLASPVLAVNLTFTGQFVISAAGTTSSNVFTNIGTGSNLQDSTVLLLAGLEYLPSQDPASALTQQYLFRTSIATRGQQLRRVSAALLFDCSIPALGVSIPALLQFEAAGTRLAGGKATGLLRLHQRSPLLLSGSTAPQPYSPWLNNGTGTDLPRVTAAYTKREHYWDLDIASSTVL
jgi:hypothetical protein